MFRTQSQPELGHTQAALNRYVGKALEMRLNRTDDTKYSFLVAQLQDPPSIRVASGWICALAAHATRLNVDSCRDLLAAIFRVDWTTDDELQKAFSHLVVELATSHSTYCSQMFRALLPHLHPKRSTPEGAVDRERTERAVSGVVETLESVCKLVPLAATPLQKIFVEQYPHPRFDIDTHRNWLRAAINICIFAPRHRESILSAVVTRLLQMDVDIKVVGEDEELFAIDLDSERAAPSTIAETNAELAAKMDALMDRLFDFVDAILGAGLPDRDEAFRLLLAIFSRYIVTTARSKYTQFLLFRACSIDERYLEQFASLLFHKATADDQSVALATRILATSYLASLLARANYASPEILTRHVSNLLNWALQYSRAFAQRATAGDPAAAVVSPSEHALFYAIVQAAMYVVCYAYTRAAPEGRALQWLASLGFGELVTGPLCPLRVCHDFVVGEFVAVAARLGEPRLEQYRRAAPSGLILPSVQAELFFPFDPYLLRHSSRHVQHLYLSWSSDEDVEDAAAAPADSDDATDDDEDNAEEDGGRPVRGMRSPRYMGVSYTTMEVSPSRSVSMPVPRRDSTGASPMSIPEASNFHLVPD